MVVAIKKYQISKGGNGTKNVKGKKINNSIIEVIPINDSGIELDFIKALQHAWKKAAKIKIINVKLNVKLN